MIAFWILAVLLVVSALAVVFLKNPMYSALALIFNMLAIAGLFALLEAHFLAAVQIIVYAGAVMVLVLFVLMLLNTKEEDTKEHSPLVIGAASGVSILIIIVSAPLLLEAFSRFPSPSENFSGSMKT